MISTVTELQCANGLVEEVKNQLREEGIAYNNSIQVGAMIETPSAAITSDILANEVSFFSIGTNDLIQYSLAVDRVNEKIAYLYEPTHPAILRLIHQVVENAHNRNVRVAMCGEMGGDPTLTVLIVGLGVDEISASPFLVPKIKKALLSVSMAQARTIAGDCLKFATGTEVKQHLNKTLRGIIPDDMSDDNGIV